MLYHYKKKIRNFHRIAYDRSMKKTTIQAAFFDIDGTLYDHETKQIPALHMEMLRALQCQGIKICLCSGRAMPLLRNLGIDDAIAWDGYVCGNGSYVYDRDRQPLYQNVIPADSARQLFQLAAQDGFGLLVAGNCVFTTRDDPDTRALLDAVSLVDIPKRDLQPEDEFCIVSLAIADTQTRRPAYEAVPHVQVLYNTLSVDIMRDDLSKYEGIKVLMRHFGFEPGAYMAFGDALNDLEMLEHAALAGAMADGDPRVLARVENHCPSVKEAGIYTFLSERGWL